MERGLRPYLFTIMAEGLAGLVQMVVEKEMFNQFNLRSWTSYNLLQFAEDVILVAERSWEDLWAMKAIFRGLR